MHANDTNEIRIKIIISIYSYH